MNSPDFEAQIRDLLTAHPEGVLPIVQAGQPVLRQVTQTYTGQLGEHLVPFLDAMHATMMDAPGVGVAATQVGVSLAIAVMGDPGTDDETDTRERTPFGYRVLINPKYEPVGERHTTYYEGCLSVEGYQAVVTRAYSVRLTGTDETGTVIDEVLTGWPARIAQHEIDHLAGTLYIDKAQTRSLSTSENLSELWSFSSEPTEAAQVLGFTAAQALNTELMP